MKKFLLIVTILCVTIASAQSIKVKGIIKDSLGVPLEFANVIATVVNSGAIESYGITNYEGRYQLDLPKGEVYNLTASFLGYQTSVKQIDVSNDASNAERNFTLNPLADALDGVELVYEMPVTVKGDTIVYNADSFNTGEERKLGDVLKNLPGVEVNDDGEVMVEGKIVQKVMVDGKDFFDGDSKLATKNIPADAVDKVEVLKNYNEVSQMRGLGNDQDNVAINIKLKEGKKNFWFGEVTAGGGLIGDGKSGYLAHPKLFYYSPKYSINFITDFNNIGEVPFTFRDYFNFTGGFRNFNSGGGTSFNISDSGLGFAVTQNNRAKELETKFFAGNFSYEINKKLNVSGFGIASDNKTNIVNNSIRQYISDRTVENTNSDNDQRSQLAMLKLSAVYKPSTSFQFDYDALIKTSKQTEDQFTLSQVRDSLNNINEVKENRPFSINQNINAYYTLDEKNIFAGQLQHLYQDEDPFYSAAQDKMPFPRVLPLDRGQNRFNINQQKNVRTNKIDGKVDYYYVLNNTSNLNFTLGTTYSNQKFNSNIFQLLDNGDRNDLQKSKETNGETFSLENDVLYGFTDIFLGLHYKVKTGQFIFTPGLTLHNYNVKNEQMGFAEKQNDWMILPDVNAIWNIKKSETLRFNYGITSQYSDVNDYAEAFVFNNYNQIFRGNRFLENSLSQNYSLNYFSFNLFNYTNINGGLNYSKKVEGVKNISDFESINQSSSTFNIDSNFPDNTYSAYGRFGKRIKKIEYSINANVSLAKSNNFVEGKIQESESFTQTYNPQIRSNFREWPNFEVGYSYSVNEYNNGRSDSKFYTQRPNASIDLRFMKNFTFEAELEYFDYRNKDNTIENTYSFLNADLYYKKGDSSWEFQLKADNILDTKSINNDSSNDFFNTTSQYLVLPRILMFVVNYEL